MKNVQPAIVQEKIEKSEVQLPDVVLARHEDVNRARVHYNQRTGDLTVVDYREFTPRYGRRREEVPEYADVVFGTGPGDNDTRKALPFALVTG
jgi:hypothetical protein